MTCKYCMVPYCENNSISTPEKIFVHVPKNAKTRGNWFKAIHSDFTGSFASNVYCCQDHFNLEEDSTNYMRYKMIGGNLLMKKDIVPHILSPPDNWEFKATDKIVKKKPIFPPPRPRLRKKRKYTKSNKNPQPVSISYTSGEVVPSLPSTSSEELIVPMCCERPKETITLSDQLKEPLKCERVDEASSVPSSEKKMCWEVKTIIPSSDQMEQGRWEPLDPQTSSSIKQLPDPPTNNARQSEILQIDDNPQMVREELKIEENISWSSLCRLCLDIMETSNVSMFVNSDKIKEDLTLIGDILSININPDCILSVVICAQCRDKLKTFKAFMAQCDHNQKFLQLHKEVVLKDEAHFKFLKTAFELRPYNSRKKPVKKVIDDELNPRKIRKKAQQELAVEKDDPIDTKADPIVIKEEPEEEPEDIEVILEPVKVEAFEMNVTELERSPVESDSEEEPEKEGSEWEAQDEELLESSEDMSSEWEEEHKLEAPESGESDEEPLMWDSEAEEPEPEQPFQYKFSCHFCEDVFPSDINHLKNHMKRAHDTNILVLCSCSEYISNVNALRKHFIVHKFSKVQKNVYKCTHCGKLFKSMRSMHNHLLRSLRKEGLENEYIPELLVKFCKCELCETTKPVAEVPIKSLNNPNLKVVCHICGLSYKTNIIKAHMNYHLTERNYICNDCGKSYKTKSVLLSHIESVHSSIAFQCSICNKVLRSRNSYSNHKKVHDSLVRFKCPTCGKTFKRSHGFKLHCQIHLGQVLQCQFCPSIVSNKANLNAHMTRYHPREREQEKARLRALLPQDRENPLKLRVCSESFENKISNQIKHHMVKNSAGQNIYENDETLLNRKRGRPKVNKQMEE